MNKHRLLSSTVLILLTIGAAVNDWLALIVVLGLTIGGLYEYFYLISKKGIPIYSYTGIAIGAAIPILIFFHFEPTKNWELIFVLLVLMMIFVLQLIRKESANAIVGISSTLFGVLYVSWFFSYLIRIRELLPGMEGVKLLGFILLVTKCGDMGALLVGSRFGKTPLLPRVSPSKTIEGGIGSFAFSIIAAVAARSFLPAELNFSLMHVALIGAFFGGLGQLGDLSESLIKRDCNVKDSGSLLPGMGGVLDAIDSLLFTAPAFYFYISAVLNT
jgi:phosphatidate cytidylyltransferase